MSDTTKCYSSPAFALALLLQQSAEALACAADAQSEEIGRLAHIAQEVASSISDSLLGRYASHNGATFATAGAMRQINRMALLACQILLAKQVPIWRRNTTEYRTLTDLKPDAFTTLGNDERNQFFEYFGQLCKTFEPWLKNGDSTVVLNSMIVICDLLDAELETIYNETRSRIPQQEHATETKFCPDCGSPMRLRTAKSGPREGHKFWGCTKYPDCKTILDCEES